MFVIIGIGLLFASILVGFLMDGGKIGALIQPNELVIIGGAALSSLLIANPFQMVLTIVKSVVSLLKPSPFSKERYMELLKMLYDLFMMARKEGLVALDKHVEHPEESEFFAQYPNFMANHHALLFLADTMKVIVTGTVASHDLAEMMDIDLETAQEELSQPAHILAKLGDAMPGFGIVAAVLGVVVTMAAIGGPPEEIGHKVAAALVGTFMGILLAYGIFSPLSSALEARVRSESAYMACIKCALLSFARGDAPLTAVEFARRNIEPSLRPSFTEMEQHVKNLGGAEQRLAA